MAVTSVEHSTLALVRVQLEAIDRLLGTGEIIPARVAAAEARAAVDQMLPPPTPLRRVAPYEQLTSAELRVLSFIDSYRTLPQIADELVISRNTVKTHVQSIYRKLAVSSRAEAVLAARERGLLPSSPLV